MPPSSQPKMPSPNRPIDQLRAEHHRWLQRLAAIDREREGVLDEYHRSYDALIDALIEARVKESHDRASHG